MLFRHARVCVAKLLGNNSHFVCPAVVRLPSGLAAGEGRSFGKSVMPILNLLCR
jgi:hypothetical protein